MESFCYPVPQYDQPVRRYCRALDLVEDEALIKEYCSLHSKERFWKEIGDGIRQVGILNMDIYRSGNHLFMILDVSEDFDWDKSFKKLAGLPRQQEWENTVAKFQKCAAGSTGEAKWTVIERIFTLY